MLQIEDLVLQLLDADIASSDCPLRTSSCLRLTCSTRYFVCSPLYLTCSRRRLTFHIHLCAYLGFFNDVEFSPLEPVQTSSGLLLATCQLVF